MKDTLNNVNPTHKKLAGTPWTTATEMKEAQQRILRAEWEQLERARAIRMLLQRPEFAFFTEAFEKGYHCKFKDKDLISLKLDKEKQEVSFYLNETLLSTGEVTLNAIDTLSNMMKAMGETFMAYYLTALKILPCEHSGIKEQSLSANNN